MPGVNRILFLTALVALTISIGPVHAELTGEEPTAALQQSGEAVVGQKAPFLSGWTTQNRVFNTTKAFKDESIERVALVFWASWCKPCLAGLRRLNAAEERFAASDLQIILVNYAEDPETVQKFLRANPQPYPIVLDRWQKSAESYLADEKGSVTLPRTVVIERGGTVQAIFSTEGNDYVDRILAGE